MRGKERVRMEEEGEREGRRGGEKEKGPEDDGREDSPFSWKTQANT